MITLVLSLEFSLGVKLKCQKMPLPCEGDTFTGVTAMSVCDECTGYYSVPGESDVTLAACPAGYYCPASTGYIQTPCPLGAFSTATGFRNLTR